jgi:hypothetical protein
MKTFRWGAVATVLLAALCCLPRAAEGQNPAPTIRVRTVTISSAQVLALNATPITLVAAPGAGFAVVFEGAHVYKAAGTAYGGIAAGEDLAISYTSGAGEDVGVCETTGFLDQATAQQRYVRPQAAALAAGTVSEVAPVANAPLVASLLVGEITTGDSAVKVRVFYRVLRTAF